MNKTKAAVATLYGQSYMKRLCRHFAHKLNVDLGEQVALIHFPFGDCNINVSDSEMIFEVDVVNAEDLDRAEDVVARHLIRMANKDEPIVEWTRESIEV